MKRAAIGVACTLAVVGGVFAAGQVGNDPEPVKPPSDVVDVVDADELQAIMMCEEYDRYSDEYERCIADH